MARYSLSASQLHCPGLRDPLQENHRAHDGEVKHFRSGLVAKETIPIDNSEPKRQIQERECRVNEGTGGGGAQCLGWADQKDKRNQSHRPRNRHPNAQIAKQGARRGLLPMWTSALY